jgi:uncharacterized protein (DUF433 family)
MTTMLAFTPEQACRVAGLSRRQLSYWDATGFFRPRFVEQTRRRFGKMYSFKDVVGLRTIGTLRDRLPLQELRRIGAWLHERYDEPWSTLRFFIVGRTVVFEDPGGVRGVAGSAQQVLPISLGEMERESEEATRSLLERTPDQLGRIVRNRYVQHNAWVIDGTRIPTSAIWDFHRAGADVAGIQREYPRLTKLDIERALEFERERQAKAG